MKRLSLFVILLVMALRAGDFKLEIPLGLDAFMPIPPENPLTPKKIALGKKLFFDKRLSRDQSLACASCHLPDNSFTDKKPVSVGVFGRTGNRRVPSLLNRGYGRAFFWDGRLSTLEEQVVQPIVNPKEMDLALDEAVERLRPEVNSAEQLANALASYVRTVLSGDSPYDRYIAGDTNALTEQQREGLDVFRGKGNCTACHIGPNLTDELFHNTGVGWKDGKFADPGRYVVTGNEKDMGAFKTPTLRNVTELGPYMHDGSLSTLEEVIEHYDGGGTANPNLDIDITPLNLTPQEKRALVAFLHALTGAVRAGSDPIAAGASTGTRKPKDGV